MKYLPGFNTSVSLSEMSLGGANRELDERNAEFDVGLFDSTLP